MELFFNLMKNYKVNNADLKSSNNISFLTAKKALLMNFTGASYHWGCYGTSIEIYHTLIERNYYVELVDVNITHGTSPTVEKLADFDDINFFLNFSKLNQGLITSLSQSDIVVINGEGTLHRLSKGSLNLLYMIYICKKYFNKKVHLINFSCFPNGDLSMPNEYSQIYINIISYLDSVIPRDCYSNKILSKCGIKTMQGFDCLPQYLNRYGFVNNHAPKGGILVSGGVSFDDNRYKLMEDFISYFLDKNITVKFLYGAQFSPASEDLYLQDRLKKNPKLSNLIIVQAKTMLEWIEEIRIASFLFSARFHHTIAALTIGTPFSYLSSNTPKISAAIETLGEDLSNLCIEEGELDILKNVAATTLLQSSSNKSEARLNKMLSLAAENFNAL